ncbi:MAG: beta-propeller domain-containing protein [Firmicutes bacterium]|nr:beta-propeller domain-containing protein [Bacillota bacterium]
MKPYRNSLDKVQASEGLKHRTAKMMEEELERQGSPATKKDRAPEYVKRSGSVFGRGRIAVASSVVAAVLFCAVFFPVFFTLTGSRDGLKNDIVRRIEQDPGTASTVPTELEEFFENYSGEPKQNGSPVDTAGATTQTVDGYIYKFQNTELSITDASDETKTASVKFAHLTPAAMYLSGNRLICVGSVSGNTAVTVYDITDRLGPKEVKDGGVSVTGRLLVGALDGNRLVLAIHYRVVDKEDKSALIPKINSAEIDAKKVHNYEAGGGNHSNFIVVLTVHLETLKVDYTAHIGLYGDYDTVYAAGKALYVFNIDFSTAAYEGSGAQRKQTGTVTTKVYKIDLTSFARLTPFVIDGAVTDRAHADVSGGNLRVAAFVPFKDIPSDEDVSFVLVCVLDGALNKLGEYEPITVGDTRWSAKFFENSVDITVGEALNPIRIDLSNPANLKPLAASGMVT